MRLVTERGKELGVAPLCAAVGIPRASFYRRQKPSATAVRKQTSPRALTQPERQQVLEILHEPRFVDLAPAEVYATLLDEGQYVCSERTMYRILSESQEVREWRNQLRHPPHAAPELLATRPIRNDSREASQNLRRFPQPLGSTSPYPLLQSGLKRCFAL